MANILVTTDFSDESKVAFEFASKLANFNSEKSNKLTLLNVLDQHVQLNINFGFGFALPDTEGVLEKLKVHAENQLEKFAKECFPEAQINTELVSSEESVYAEIIRFAKDNAVDHIVMATHGRTGASHLFIGSVAERVVRQAPCPVTVVPVKRSN